MADDGGVWVKIYPDPDSGGGIPEGAPPAPVLTNPEGGSVIQFTSGGDGDAGPTLAYGATITPDATVVVDQDNLEVAISGTEPFTDYVVEVFGMNVAGRGEGAKTDAFQLNYNEATGGDVVDEYTVLSDNTRWRYHKFTTVGNSTFTVTEAPKDFRVLVVAGGGGGSSETFDGGGGGGGMLENVSVTTSTGPKTITVGAGGGANGNGGNSSALGITANGGGHGGQYAAGNGGSGGGSGRQAGGTGIAGQGHNGGTGYNNNAGGGGGGANAAGAGSTGQNGGAGGAGRSSTITGSSTHYAGGGGGGGINVGASGGIGGGGRVGTNGTNGLGGGGGGNKGAGGSGVVIVAYQIGTSTTREIAQAQAEAAAREAGYATGYDVGVVDGRVQRDAEIREAVADVKEAVASKRKKG